VCTLIVKLRDNMGLVVFNEKDGSLGYDRWWVNSWWS
jgi:hypothetical protein